MTLHIHTLKGCTPTPLAHYLKALGVLRLVSEQKDENVRGWWENDVFRIATVFNEKAVMDFFLYEYTPTPIIAPWNGASGFYPKGTKIGIDDISSSLSDRFALYRDAIDHGKKLVSDKEESPKGREKATFIQACRSQWRGSLLDALSVAIVINSDGAPAYPALLGTGWNDGHLDFSNNFMQNLASLFDMQSTEGHPLPKTAVLFKDALFMESSPEANSNRAVGQFLPGGVGGANATSGFMAKSALNPVDFILMLEGCLCFSASANRILSSKKMPQAAAPFAVRSRAVGYGSGAPSDETARGEQWMPLWGTPLTYQAFKQFLGEGRSMCGSKNAERSFDFARSIARLGVARGITEFQRFGYIERNGQANLATPLGRWRVQPQPHQDLLDEIAPWIDRLRRASNGKNAPACLSRACRTCDEAVMSCCRDGKTKLHWLNLLVALGEAEAALVGSPKIATDPQKSLRPLPAMSRQWIQAADMGTPEFRLALAFASQGTLNDQKKPDWGGTIRRHLVPLDKTLHKFAPLSDSRAWKNELVVKTDFERAAREIMQRRLLWKKSSEPFPLGPLGHEGIQLADLQAFFDHTIDDNQIMSLIRPFMAIRKPSEIQWQFKDSSGVRAGDLSIFALLKLCHLPWAIPLGESEITVRTDPGIIARLEAGDLPQAVAIALRRLRASGLRPHIVTALGSPGQSRRLAAALAFPITPQQAKMFVMSLTKPTIELSRELLEQKD